MKKNILIEKKWFYFLEEEFCKPYMKNIQNFLKKEKKTGQIIYPEEGDIFSAFYHTPFDNLKVVIIGQDPYHGPGQAHGLSFSVKKNVEQPPSLKNIFKELVDDIGIIYPKTGYLMPWAKQGVLLLNSVLTVRKGSPQSHYGIGWEIFTDKVVEKIIYQKDNIVFLLWGKAAKEKCKRVLEKVENKNHLILTAAHPSFYSAANFFGCKHFSQTNSFLKKNGKKMIDWQIE